MNKSFRFIVPIILACGLLGLSFYLVEASRNQAFFPGEAILSGAGEGGILVTTLEDELNSDGDCSLREAITAANENRNVDECPAGDAIITDTISFSVSGTISLASQLEIIQGGALIIDGEGQITVSGGDIVRIFMVGVGAQLRIEGLLLTDGHMQGDGGGIFNFGSLTITNSIVTDNAADSNAGGIYNIGSLTVYNSIVSGNNASGNGALGGGIENWENGHLVLSDTIISNNSTINGGGIYNNGLLEITNCTISDNYATYRGGGIYNSSTLLMYNSAISGNSAADAAGGINNYGTLTIINSTLSGNSSQGNFWGGGGIYNNTVSQAITHITNSTIYGNSSNAGGGAIEKFPTIGEVVLSNTIVSSNFPINCQGDIIDGNNNIDDSNSCSFAPANGSMPNTNPLLGPLQDNGGLTWTHALIAGSPAIDAGDNAQCPPTDQRGVPRPMDGNGNGIAKCDIGAFEIIYQPLSLFPLVFK